MPRHPPPPQSSDRSQRGRAAAPALPCLWGSQIQTVVPAVSERRLLGAEGDETWTKLQDWRGLASPFQAREHAWTHRGRGNVEALSPTRPTPAQGSPIRGGGERTPLRPASGSPESQDQRDENISSHSRG